MKTKKIIIFGPNWIGDSIMSTSLISSLRSELNFAHIVMAVKSHVASLWETNPDINELWLIKTSNAAKKMFCHLELINKIRKSHFDTAIILPHFFSYALYSFLSGVKHRVAFNVNFRGIFLTKPLKYSLQLRERHMIDNYLDFLRSLGFSPKVKQPKLVLTPEDECYANSLFSCAGLMRQELIVGLAPAAIYGPAKYWPKEYYAKLADEIIDKYNAKIVIFTGPGELKLAKDIAAIMRNYPVVMAAQNNLRHVACMLKRCALLVCNDSGLMHLAAAVGVRTVAIFGSTSPKWTSPYGSIHTVIKKPLNCSPCFRRKCKDNSYKCLKSITVDEVLGAIKTQLESCKYYESSVNIYR